MLKNRCKWWTAITHVGNNWQLGLYAYVSHDWSLHRFPCSPSLRSLKLETHYNRLPRARNLSFFFSSYWDFLYNSKITISCKLCNPFRPLFCRETNACCVYSYKGSIADVYSSPSISSHSRATSRMASKSNGAEAYWDICSNRIRPWYFFARLRNHCYIWSWNRRVHRAFPHSYSYKVVAWRWDLTSHTWPLFPSHIWKTWFDLGCLEECNEAIALRLSW